MKTNKEFIDGIYEKYDEYLKEKTEKKYPYVGKITNIAAILIIVFSLIIVSDKVQSPTNTIENKATTEVIEETQISLKTVGNFDNFYKLVQENYNSNQKQNYKESIEDAAMNKQEESSSRTNTQVENVDEADIVKVDQNYIYYISEQKIVIIDATSPKDSKKISEIKYEENFNARELYINNNKMIVIGGKYDNYTTTCKTVNKKGDIAYINNKSVIILYDIADRSNPKEIRKIEVNGNYLSSRMIGDNIYFASTQNIYASSMLKIDKEELNETDYMPKYSDTLTNEENKCIDYSRIYCFEEMENTNYLMLVGFNIENSEDVDIQTFLGAGEYLYASEKNMYIAVSQTKYDKNYNFKNSSTHILKFALNNGKIKFDAETDVNGIVNNQFSMDENGEYFRIATTVGKTWDMDKNTSNNLYVLNDKLEEVGKITKFAKAEKIYSVRYVGNKAYVVTFKEVDPLFVIDLSNPSKPKILGELKIPGYSTYLHPYDETHLIGFGYDTKADGTRITTNGLKMVMFDISDFENPKELFKITVSDQNAYSSLEYNHKALLYSKEKNIIAFPLTIYGNKLKSKAVIYQIGLDKGFTLKGEISNNYDYDYKKEVERIVFVNNTYFALSKSIVKVADMDTLKVIKEIKI